MWTLENMCESPLVWSNSNHFLNIYYASNAVQNTLHNLISLAQQLHELGVVIIPILEIRIVRHKEPKQLTQGLQLISTKAGFRP